MKHTQFKSKLLTLSSLVFVALVLTATISAASATTLNKQIDGKGAIAQWAIPGPGGLHIINAIVYESNSGKDGSIYVSINHPIKGVSEASGPVSFKWNMNHVTVEGTLFFDGPGRTGTHNIAINWLTDGSTYNNPLEADTGNGLEASINGKCKLGVAELGLMNDGGHHVGSFYSSSWAVVVHGTADVSLINP